MARWIEKGRKAEEIAAGKSEGAVVETPQG